MKIQTCSSIFVSDISPMSRHIWRHPIGYQSCTSHNHRRAGPHGYRRPTCTSSSVRMLCSHNHNAIHYAATCSQQCFRTHSSTDTVYFIQLRPGWRLCLLPKWWIIYVTILLFFFGTSYILPFHRKVVQHSRKASSSTVRHRSVSANWQLRVRVETAGRGYLPTYHQRTAG